MLHCAVLHCCAAPLHKNELATGKQSATLRIVVAQVAFFALVRAVPVAAHQAVAAHRVVAAPWAEGQDGKIELGSHKLYFFDPGVCS